jgi:ribonuclease HI
MNALPFDLRRTQAGMRGRHGLGPSCCLFCDQSVDSGAHVYGHCSVVRKARQMLALRLQCILGDDLPSVVLAFPATSQLRSLITCAFNYAVWYIRTHLLATLDRAMPEDEICNKIVSLACSTIPADKSVNRGELASKALANNPPVGVVSCYTDGSALGSPGPCGGGFVIVRTSAAFLEESVPLGIGYNNLGEMGALLALLNALLRLHLEGGIPEERIIIFTDSACCVGYLERGWNNPTELSTARRTRTALHKLRALKTVSLFWIRGHSQVHWNEVADKLARVGADMSQHLEQNPLQQRGPSQGPRRRPPPQALTSEGQIYLNAAHHAP